MTLDTPAPPHSDPQPDLDRPDLGPDEAERADYLGLVFLVGALLALGFLASWWVVAMVLAVVVMIFLHELGHYVMAKRAGMKVTEFFIGFGPRLWSFRRGETEYGFKAIPAGAYVRIIGMNNLEEVDPADEARTYRQASFPARIGVAVAGSFMHYVLALVCLFGLFTFIGQADEDDWTVADIVEGSAAETAGLQGGDRLLAIDGHDVGLFVDLVDVVRPLAGQDVVLTVERDGQTLELPATIGERVSDEAAAGIEGIVPGDRLLALDGEPVATWAEFVSRVEPGGEYQATVVADSAIVDVSIVVNQIVTEGATDGFLGIGSEEPLEPLDPIEAVGRTASTFGRVVTDIVPAMGRIFSPEGLGGFFSDSLDSVGDDDTDIPAGDEERLEIDDENRVISIVGGVRIGAQAAEQSLGDGIAFFALLNLFVGTFNLIPLLPLDGGHVVVAVYERIRSRKGRRYHADVAKLMPLTYGVVAVLVSVGVVAILRDILDPVNLPQ